MNENLYLEGTLQKIIFKSDKDSFLIGIFLVEDEYLTITGYLPKAVEGTNYKIWGDFTYHKKYGEQFKIDKAELTMPKGEEEIISFLASKAIKGIGEQKAKAIVAMFGSKTFEIIENEPRKLLQVKDIGEKTLEHIVESFEKYGKGYKVYSYFQRLGLSPAMIDKVYRTYEEDAIRIFEENPYEFAKDIDGLGFMKIDEVALSKGVERENPNRIKMAIEYLLQKEASLGNVYVEKDELLADSSKLLSLEKEKIKNILHEMALDLTIKIDFQNDKVVYLMKNLKMENYVAQRIFELASGSVKLSYAEDELITATEKTYGIKFSKEQKIAIKGCLKSKVSIITGGPGTGKTTVIRGLLRIFESEEREIVLAAPTGRAAKRITETTGREAKTIHRLLEYYSDENQMMRFNRNSDNKLEEDVIILDEASMIDLSLMHSILKALKDDCQLIIVGDEDQLQSVGMGNVLGDMIRSEKLACFKLEDIFRQAKESNIITHAHEINKGIIPKFTNDKNGDLFFIEKLGDNNILNTIKELVEYRLERFFNINDKIVDVQIISPAKKGVLGNENINGQIQNLLNPPSIEKNYIEVLGNIMRCGDKVMHTKNNYEIKWINTETNKEGRGIFNGELGIIDDIDYQNELVYIIFDEEKRAVYDFEDIKELTLGYSMTVHKSQGSEFPVVIIPLYRLPNMLAHRNLIYTAITRGKEGVVLVGDRKYLDLMITNKFVEKRKSNLTNRIKNYFGDK